MIKNTEKANMTLITSHGMLIFDKNGVLVEPKELSEQAIESITELKGYERIEPESKKEEKGKKEKEEKKDKEEPQAKSKKTTKAEPKGKTGIKKPSKPNNKK